MIAADELTKLNRLHDDGTITDEQYERAKAKLRDKEAAPQEEKDREADERAERRRRRREEDEDEEDEDEEEEDEERALRRRRERRKKSREWCMILHLSLFAGHAVPLGGIIAPIIIWQTKKEEMPELDEHGKNAVNWLISYLLYMAISIVLCLVFVGFVLVPIVAILGIVFPIVAAIKANEGRVWKYPLAIPFFN